MSALNACRVCLAENLTMYRVTSSPYEEIYEKLTNAKLGKIYPDTLCYICVSVLRKFQKFATLAQHSNIKLKQWYKKEIECKPTTKPMFTISTTTVEYVSMINTNNDEKMQIKVEQNEDTEEPTTEMQFIEFTNETDPYIEPEDDNDFHNDYDSDADQKPDVARMSSNEEFEVPVVKKEPKKRAVKRTVKAETKGNPGIQKKEATDKTRQNITKKNIEKKEKDKLKKTNGNFTCDICEYKTPRRYRLLNHIEKIHEKKNEEKDTKENDTKNLEVNPKKATTRTPLPPRPKKFACDFCPYKSNGTFRLKIHLKNQHKNIKLTCNICPYNASTYNDLLKHKIKTHLEKKYICEICDLTFHTQRYIERHIRIHLPKKYKCQFCKYKCTRKRYLNNHVIVNHSKEKKYMCHICNYRCSLLGKLYRHLTIHNKDKRRFKCEHCGQKFTRNEHLQRHIRVHTGEKPFVCPVCGQRFNQDSSMKLHLKRHYKK